MRVLWVKAGKLLPVDTGGKIRSYHLAKALAERHSLTFLSYYDGSVDAEYERQMRQEFPGAEVVPTRLPAGKSAGIVAHYLLHLWNTAPYAVERYHSAEVQSRVMAFARERRFDAMVCDFLSAARNFPVPLVTPTLLFQHNVESALWERRARFERHPLKRLAYRYEAGRMLRFEREAMRRFHHVVAVSQHDRSLFSAWTDPARVSVVPTGVDVGYYADARRRPEHQEPLVLFLGSMDWEPNVDGVEWFCEAIWPAVRAAVPEARFRIVGRDPVARVRRLAGVDNVAVTGSVPSVLEHLREAAVFVVPLRVGGGTRLKIYEAMAAGTAVVSTSVGAEGLEARSGHDVVLEDDPAAFAAAVIGLLRDPARRRMLGDAAAATASRFDWSAVVGAFEDAVRRAISEARVTGTPPGVLVR